MTLPIVLRVAAALTEAQDINVHLQPLKNMFQDIEQLDYDQLETQLAPLMHVICLVWANSDYYNIPARIVVLLQETFNMIIEMVSGIIGEQRYRGSELSSSFLSICRTV